MRIWKPLVLAICLVAFGASVIGAALIWRGFAATGEPTSFEAVIARAVRNIAIPRRARNERNPLKVTASALEAGRSAFLAQCAGCHGHDGEGLTPVGRNLYPRVPDLRAAPTQRLTDGQLHYLIENGVQLTGMPAWDHRRGATPDEIWKLVLYIRSLGHPSAGVAAAAPTGASRYVGSQACASCHQDIFDRWKRTPMANVVRDPREHPDAILPDLSTDSVAKFKREDVALVYGSLWKQRYFTKIGDDYFPEPAQWAVGAHQWLPYHVPDTADWWTAFYPADNMQRPTGPTCDGCHSVGYDIRTRKVAEWNVGCERCHGPGSAHVRDPLASNILNPARLDVVAASDTCIQCHSQGRPRVSPIEGKYYDWPVGYDVGLKLQDFWTLEDHTLGETTFTHFADGTARKNRMQGNDFVQSVMYRRGVTCADCHDVHGTKEYAQLRKPAQALCLDCHGPRSANGPRAATIEEHTHHRPDSAGSACVACHMPKIETQGVPGAAVRAHTFRFIPPSMTDKYKIPNSCTTCHTDKSTAWAADALRGWSQTSPWRTR